MTLLKSNNLHTWLETESHYPNIYEKVFFFFRSKQNIRTLAILRGATAGVTYADAFMLLKEVH